MSYSIKEIVDIAIGIEEAGIAFYRGCAEKFANSDFADIFTFLEGQEKEHKEKFAAIHGQNIEPSGIFSDEYFYYMKSIGGGKIFGGHKNNQQILDSIKDETGAIQHAFNDERESILFYSEMKKMYSPEDPSQQILDSIIEEERQHILTLLDMAEKIKLSK